MNTHAARDPGRYRVTVTLLVVAFWLALANAAIVCGRLVRRPWPHYPWDGRPRLRP